MIKCEIIGNFVKITKTKIIEIPETDNPRRRDQMRLNVLALYNPSEYSFVEVEPEK